MQTPEYEMETSGITSQKEIQNSTINGKIVDTFGMHKRQFWNINKRGTKQ
jgi:hypothetical protein